jgi:glutamine---fructose-6-phosphate transaminase (isomerizing)
MSEDMPRPKAKASEPSTDKPQDSHRYKRALKTGVELREQGKVMRVTIEEEKGNIKKIAKKINLKNYDRVYLLGCGDSWFVNIGVRYAMESLLRIPCEAVQALDFDLYYNLKFLKSYNEELIKPLKR